jgi:hypothetical protein
MPDPATAGAPIVPRYVKSIARGRYSSESAAITAWIQGDTNLNGTYGDGADAPLARLFTVNRYTGSLQSLQLEGSGVSTP